MIGKKISHSLVLLVTSLLAGLAGCAREPAEDAQRTERPIRHIILITVDTLRQDALSVYGSESVSTPHMDELARDGIIFREAYTVATWTIPSLASLMTGLSPKVHQMVYLDSRLSDGVTTLAEDLRDDGYLTAALVVNALLTPDANLSQGFLHYEFRLLTTDELTQAAIQWLQENRKRDFFLWLHYIDPHAPFQPPVLLRPPGEPAERIGVAFVAVPAVRHGDFVLTAAEQAWIRKLYEAEVRYVDRNLGRLFRALKELGLYDDSLVILTSDHGEEFWEHGSVGHGHTLYEELLRVPLIIKLPSPATLSETDVPVALTALRPTILDLCQVTYAKDSLSHGSLTPFWDLDTEVLEPQPIITKSVNPDLEAVIFADFKYIRSASAEHPGEELYNLAQDPGEKTSLVASAPDTVRQARELLDADSKQARDLRVALRLETTPAREIPEDLMRRLKALGYVE